MFLTDYETNQCFVVLYVFIIISNYNCYFYYYYYYCPIIKGKMIVKINKTFIKIDRIRALQLDIKYVILFITLITNNYLDYQNSAQNLRSSKEIELIINSMVFALFSL